MGKGRLRLLGIGRRSAYGLLDGFAYWVLDASLMGIG